MALSIFFNLFRLYLYSFINVRHDFNKNASFFGNLLGNY